MWVCGRCECGCKCGGAVEVFSQVAASYLVSYETMIYYSCVYLYSFVYYSSITPNMILLIGEEVFGLI